jgi:sugar-specific transcriptional regulator TrmB
LTQTLEQARELLERRLKELDQERDKVRRALQALGQDSNGSRPSRRRKAGTRADAALTFLKQHPGATPAELAKALRVKPNYAYRILHAMSKDDLVRKEGKGYVPVA